MWDVMQNRRIIFGAGKFFTLPEELLRMNAKSVFLLVRSRKGSFYQKLVNHLRSLNINVAINDSLSGEPSIEDANKIANDIVQSDSSVVVAIGGGSIIDTAKAAAMLATNGGLAEEYQAGVKVITKKPLKIIAVPTTAGTGSEATRVSVLYNPRTKLKKSIYSPDMVAETVILDPELTQSMPREVTISTGIDAMSHAIESLVSLNATPYTRMFGFTSLELIWQYLPDCVKNPNNLHARGQLLLASYMGGVAINAGIGLAHIIAQPLGGLLGIPHGVACAIFLPYAMEFNLEYSIPIYSSIARILGANGIESLQLAKEGVDRVRAFLKNLGAPDSIKTYLNKNEFDLEEGIQTIMRATGHIKCNPRPVTLDVLRNTLSSVM